MREAHPVVQGPHGTAHEHPPRERKRDRVAIRRAADLRRDRAEAGGQERGGGAEDRLARPGRRPGRGAVRPALPDDAEPGPPRRLGPRVPARPVPVAAIVDPARLRTDDGRRRSTSSAAIEPAGTLYDERRQDLRRGLARPGRRPATGACWSIREYGGSGHPVRGVRAVPDPDGDDRPDGRRARLGPRLHRRGRPAPDLRHPRAEATPTCPGWPAASGSRRSR